MPKDQVDIPRNRYISDAWLLDGTLEHQVSDGIMYYSPQYSDAQYVYRHINVPRKTIKRAKELLVLYGIKNYGSFQNYSLRLSSRTPDESLLPYEDIVTKLGIHMSNDWILYLIHDRDATLCFKRPRRDE